MLFYFDFYEDVTEGVVKAVCRVLLTTLPRYHKNASRKLVQDVVLTLLQHHNVLTVQHLSASLALYATAYKNVAAS